MTQQEILKALQDGQEILEKLTKARRHRRYVYLRSYELNEKSLMLHEFDSVKHLVEPVHHQQSPFTHYKLKL